MSAVPIQCKYCEYKQYDYGYSECINCGRRGWRGSQLKGVESPTTQKAKGMKVLEANYSEFHPLPILSVYAILKASNEIKIPEDSYVATILKEGNIFARPCPPTPEHGFVESRVVKSVDELESLRKETLAANPDSEIMLTHLCKADLNAVWTPTMLGVGPGHDGATSGKNAVSFPLAGLSTIKQSTLTQAGVGDDKHPYIEAVQEGHNQWIVTQLRAGPILEAGTSIDFVPAPITVTRVVRTNGEDLLEWARIVKALKGESDVVVYHPGGILTDHFSVHCREHGVPLLISREPVVGEALAPIGQLPPLDPHAMIEGLATIDRMNCYGAVDAGLPYDNKLGGSMVYMLLTALHNSSVLRGPHSFWIGAAVGAIIKLGVAALAAEARHAHNCYKALKQKPDIYNYYAAKRLGFLRPRLSRLTQLLHYGWGEEGEKGKTGYGGLNWALCGAALCPLYNGVRDLINKPTEENASKLLLALNVAVNQAHNGGWWLNKYADVSAYDRIPQGHSGYVIQAATAIYVIEQERKTVDEYLPKFIKSVASWPETRIEPLKWRRASLEVSAGYFTLNLKAATVPSPKQIVIPATSTFVKSLLAASGAAISIKPGKIDLITPDGETNVWTENRLEAVARPQRHD